MYTIRKADRADLKHILQLQKIAYESEAVLYNDWSLPPLVQSIESLENEFTTSTVLKALMNQDIIGSVRAEAADGVCTIKRLIVHPQYQGQGIGSALLKAIEHEYSHLVRYELFTGSISVANIKLYQRHGYTITHTKSLSETVSITYLEKDVIRV